VERLTRAREQGGSIHLRGLPIYSGVFYKKPGVYVKKIANAKTASVNHAQRHFVRSGTKNLETRYGNTSLLAACRNHAIPSRTFLLSCVPDSPSFSSCRK
jgi:hypothetical protein